MFVAAWHRLSELREPAKLRAWLCGIARNVSAKALRRSGREAPGDASVQAAIDSEGSSASPLDAALQQESERLVWAALHRPDLQIAKGAIASGRVVDAATGMGVAGASSKSSPGVRLWPAASPISAAARSRVSW